MMTAKVINKIKEESLNLKTYIQNDPRVGLVVYSCHRSLNDRQEDEDTDERDQV